MPVIDLHTHVLAGIDDGPADLPGSLELLAAAAEEGTVTLAATPHVRADHPDVVPAELGGRVSELAGAAAEAGIDVELVAGGEVDLLWAQRADDDELRAVSFGQRGHDLLVETPVRRAARALRGPALQRQRSRLSHPAGPSRAQPDVPARPERLATLVEHGTLLQVTALSLSSTERRSRSRRLARELVAHWLATSSPLTPTAATSRAAGCAPGSRRPSGSRPCARSGWSTTRPRRSAQPATPPARPWNPGGARLARLRRG